MNRSDDQLPRDKASAGADYRFRDDAMVIAFVQAHTQRLDLSRPARVQEIGDGNLNFVYRVSDHRGQSLIVKQALPFIRIIGESWPLTRDRIRIEAEALQLQARWSAAQVPELLHFSAAESAILMEDIGDHRNLRHLLIERRMLPGLGDQLAGFLASTLFHTSDLYLNSRDKQAQLVRFSNPELSGISEEVYFIDPFCDHERNRVNPLLLAEAQRIWADEGLRAEVAALKYAFMNQTQALIHGDLHTGSVFAREGSIKVIDPEFACCGPIGFDPGTLLANLLLNYVAQMELPGPEDERRAYRDYLLAQVRALWLGFSERFLALATADTRDQGLHSTQWQRDQLAQFFADMLGFAGVEMMRRTLGIAHVEDLERIEDDAARASSEGLSLALASYLITQRSRVADVESLLQQIQALADERLPQQTAH